MSCCVWMEYKPENRSSQWLAENHCQRKKNERNRSSEFHLLELLIKCLCMKRVLNIRDDSRNIYTITIWDHQQLFHYHCVSFSIQVRVRVRVCDWKLHGTNAYVWPRCGWQRLWQQKKKRIMCATKQIKCIAHTHWLGWMPQQILHAHLLKSK